MEGEKCLCLEKAFFLRGGCWILTNVRCPNQDWPSLWINLLNKRRLFNPAVLGILDMNYLPVGGKVFYSGRSHTGCVNKQEELSWQDCSDADVFCPTSQLRTTGWSLALSVCLLHLQLMWVCVVHAFCLWERSRSLSWKQKTEYFLMTFLFPCNLTFFMFRICWHLVPDSRRACKLRNDRQNAWFLILIFFF